MIASRSPKLVRRWGAAVTLLVALAAMGGCDSSFEPFEETDRAYSVFGYLDASADRQYVRIEPLQDTVFAGSDSVNARVTSENLGTDRMTVWKGRTFRVRGVRVHNFTTAVDLEPEGTYRFTVERQSDGATSTAEVTLPPAFPPPELLNPPGNGTQGTSTLLVEGVEHLGGVRADIDYELCSFMSCSRRQSATFHLNDTTRTGPSSWSVTIDWKEQLLEEFEGSSIGAVYAFSVTVAAASEDWPAYAEDNPPGGGPDGQPLPPPGINSNIENGVGFLGGAFTRTVEASIEP